MAKIEANIELEVPVEKVFDFVAEVADNHPRFFHFVGKIKPTSAIRRGMGATFLYEVKAGGVKTWFENRAIRYVENERIDWKSIAGIKNEGRWAFTPTERGTKVTLFIEYELPASYLGRVLDRLFVKREIRKDINESLQRLKAILEEESSGVL